MAEACLLIRKGATVMSSLQHTIRLALGWYYSLGRKFFSVTPVATIVGQAASLFSQTLLILSLFLPIKVLVLIGTDRVPDYYPAYLQSLEKTHLIVVLSILAVACYGLYAAAEVVVHLCSISGAKKLIDKSSKLKLFEHQQPFSVKVYSRFVRGLAAGFFFLGINVVLLFIYPLLVLMVIFYLSTMGGIVVLLHNKKTTVRQLFSSHKSKVVNLLSSVGFLILFVFMMVDHIYLSEPRVFIAVLSLLLVRQGFSRLAVMIQDVIELRRQYRKINALFFYDQQWIAEPATDVAFLSHLFDEPRRKQWMAETLLSIDLKAGSILSTQWHQLGRVDVYAYEALLSSSETGSPTRLLFKIFGPNSSSLAQQESVLLECLPSLPAPEFLGSARVQSLTCHLFVLHDHRKLIAREVGAGVLDINRRLLSIEPADSLTAQFSRSHLFLEQRLSSDILEHLKVVASGAESLLLERFRQVYRGIQQILAQLPRQIVTPDTTADTLLASEASGVCISHWANWRIEPVGANWAVGERMKLEEAIAAAQQARPSLSRVNAASIVLCAHVYTFERLCHRTQYQSALALVPEILSLFESINPTSSTQEDIECHA